MKKILIFGFLCFFSSIYAGEIRRGNFIKQTATITYAVDSDKLDGNDSTYFLSADSSTATNLQKTGKVTINGAYTFPQADGNLNDVPVTNGAGVVSWAAPGGADNHFTKTLYPFAAQFPITKSAVAQADFWEVGIGTQPAQLMYFPLSASTSAFYMLDISTYECSGNSLGSLRAYIKWTSTTANAGNGVFIISVASNTLGQSYRTRTYTKTLTAAVAAPSVTFNIVQTTVDLTGFNTLGGYHIIALGWDELETGDTLTSPPWILSVRLEEQ